MSKSSQASLPERFIPACTKASDFGQLAIDSIANAMKKAQTVVHYEDRSVLHAGAQLLDFVKQCSALCIDENATVRDFRGLLKDWTAKEGNSTCMDTMEKAIDESGMYQTDDEGNPKPWVDFMVRLAKLSNWEKEVRGLTQVRTHATPTRHAQPGKSKYTKKETDELDRKPNCEPDSACESVAVTLIYRDMASNKDMITTIIQNRFKAAEKTVLEFIAGLLEASKVKVFVGDDSELAALATVTAEMQEEGGITTRGPVYWYSLQGFKDAGMGNPKQRHAVVYAPLGIDIKKQILDPCEKALGLTLMPSVPLEDFPALVHDTDTVAIDRRGGNIDMAASSFALGMVAHRMVDELQTRHASEMEEMKTAYEEQKQKEEKNRPAVAASS